MSTRPSILQERKNFRPFLYPAAFEFHQAQQNVHWLPKEVQFASDIQEFRTEFTEQEKHAVTTILKTFTATENVVADYWSGVVSKWFRHPEIVMMANTFASFEAIHAEAYDRLNTELGLDSKEFYLSFLENPDMKKKMEFVENALKVECFEDLPLSLACFSAFTEGVSLYGSFAILLNFQQYNKLKNVGNLLAWSTRDESLHSKAGCWLFNELVREMNLSKDARQKLNEQVLKISQYVYELECANIDEIFKLGDFCGLTAEEMKAFIWDRTVSKLNEIEVPHDMEMKPQNISHWFNEIVDGREFVDFFEARSSAYAKGWDFSEVSW
jgi:ribonucleoside-diphosphate reductase beta chain